MRTLLFQNFDLNQAYKSSSTNQIFKVVFHSGPNVVRRGFTLRTNTSCLQWINHWNSQSACDFVSDSQSGFAAYSERIIFALLIRGVSVSRMTELVFGKVKEGFARFMGTVMRRILLCLKQN